VPNGPAQFISQLTGRQPGIWPSALTGPALGAVGATALGAGLGYVGAMPLGVLSPHLDPKRTRRSAAIAGALAGAAYGAMDMHLTDKARPEGAPRVWPFKEAGAGWVGVPLPPEAAAVVRQMADQVKDEDLHPKGRDRFPHATLMYGLADKSPESVRRLLADQGPINLTLGRTSLFRQKDYDVLKADVASRDLRRLNKLLGTLPHESSFRYYSPHVTLAYLKPGAGDKYIARPVQAPPVKADKVQFNHAHGDYVDIPLNSVTRHKEQADQGVTKASDFLDLAPSPVRKRKKPGVMEMGALGLGVGAATAAGASSWLSNAAGPKGIEAARGYAALRPGADGDYRQFIDSYVQHGANTAATLKPFNVPLHELMYTARGSSLGHKLLGPDSWTPESANHYGEFARGAIPAWVQLAREVNISKGTWVPGAHELPKLVAEHGLQPPVATHAKYEKYLTNHGNPSAGPTPAAAIDSLRKLQLRPLPDPAKPAPATVRGLGPLGDVVNKPVRDMQVAEHTGNLRAARLGLTPAQYSDMLTSPEAHQRKLESRLTEYMQRKGMGGTPQPMPAVSPNTPKAISVFGPAHPEHPTAQVPYNSDKHINMPAAQAQPKVRGEFLEDLKETDPGTWLRQGVSDSATGAVLGGAMEHYAPYVAMADKIHSLASKAVLPLTGAAVAALGVWIAQRRRRKQEERGQTKEAGGRGWKDLVLGGSPGFAGVRSVRDATPVFKDMSTSAARPVPGGGWIKGVLGGPVSDVERKLYGPSIAAMHEAAKAVRSTPHATGMFAPMPAGSGVSGGIAAMSGSGTVRHEMTHALLNAARRGTLDPDSLPHLYRLAARSPAKGLNLALEEGLAMAATSRNLWGQTKGLLTPFLSSNWARLYGDRIGQRAATQLSLIRNGARTAAGAAVALPSALGVRAATAPDAPAGPPPVKASNFNPFFSQPFPSISVSTAANTILADPTMGMSERAVAFEMLSNASDGREHGVITHHDLMRGAVSAGVGYAQGALLGKALGAVFGLPASAQSVLAGAGLVGGILRSSGVLR